MKIRKANNKDKEKIKELIKEVLEEIFKSKAKGLEDLDNIEDNFESFWVVEDKGEIIGTLGLKNEGDVRISRMYIKQTERGKGVGSKLIKKALDYCNNRFKRIFLTTYPQMNSKGFYEKIGFKEFKQDEQIWMEKMLK